MNEELASSQWAAERGEKWRTHLTPLEAMLTPIDEPLIRALSLDASHRIADVGCGGGGTTRKIHQQAPQGSVVHGFDISPDLVEEATARSAGLGIQFRRSDVSTAQAPTTPYDRLVSRFGTMFYDDPPKAFGNLRRWLVPGGRCVFAVWGPPAANPWASSLKEAIADVIDVSPVDPDDPGPFRYAGASKLLGLLDGAGFEHLESVDWQGKLPVGGGLSAVESVDFAMTTFSVASVLDGEDSATFQTVRQALIERFQDHEQDGEVHLDAHVHFVTGRRPA